MITTVTESTLNQHLRQCHGYTYETLRSLMAQGWTHDQFQAAHDRLHSDDTAVNLEHKHPA